uniref:Uncharacterized protein n=1 Tax=Oryza nivara TaxID=4536 RepID=A0A0E0GZ19_ORYNI
MEAIQGKTERKILQANLPMERVLQTVPNTVDESQWPTLVSYWYSKDSKKISDRNQENALKHPHTLGRKSFTRKRKELEVNGVEVDRETFFDECHKTKDGRYVTDATQEKMNEVYMKLAEKRVDSQQLTEADFEQAMLDVFGKDHSGRVRGMGPTITPTNYYGGRFLNISAINEQGTSSSNRNIPRTICWLGCHHPLLGSSQQVRLIKTKKFRHQILRHLPVREHLLSLQLKKNTCNPYNLTQRRTTVAQVKTSVPRALPNLSVIATK